MATDKKTEQLPETNAIGGEVIGVAGLQEFTRQVPELKDDRPAIRAALKESRRRHTTRVTSKLP